MKTLISEDMRKGVGISLFSFCFFVINLNTVDAGQWEDCVDWPERISQFDGWKDISIRKNDNCEKCYSLVFPDGFGLVEKERYILKNIAKKKVEMEYDIDASLLEDEDVASHIYQTAMNRQSDELASILVFPTEEGLTTGAGLSNRLFYDYSIRLIKNYNQIDKIIEENDYEKVASDICEAMASRFDFSELKDLVNSLKNKGMHGFANTITSDCSNIKDLMEKHGESFIK